MVDMGTGTAATATAGGMDWTKVYFDQGEQGYDEADEGLPLPKLNDDTNDLAPFIPADKAAVLCALQTTGAGIGDRLIDIGSGDGRFCVAAAQQAGVAAALGLELDPGLVAKSRAAAAACSLGPPQVQFLEADATALDFKELDAREGPFTIAISFLTSDVEGVGGVTAFLREVVERGGRVVSVHFALEMPGLKLLAEDRLHRVLVYGAA